MALFSKKQQNLPRRRQASPQQDERAAESDLEERYSFRRNRTITGSASSRVTSTNEANAQIKSPRVQAHELTRKRRHIGAILLLVIAGSLALYGLVSQFTADPVVKMQNDPSVKLDSSYADAIQSYLSSQPVERLRFLTNEDKLSEYLQAKTPEVATIKVDGSAGFGKTAFTVTMREPIAGWSINGRQQYVDGSGVAFGRNYFTAPSVQIIDKSGVQVEAGQAVASNRFLSFVGQAVGLSKKQGYTVEQVIIPAGTTRQVALRLKGVGYTVKLLIDREPSEQIEDMARAVRWLHAHHKHPKYLDVRVAGEAFYR